MSPRAGTGNEPSSAARSRERLLSRAETVVAAGRELFYETDGRDFTVQELSARAGISLQTFYRYFRSKDELLLAVLEEALRDSMEQIGAQARRHRSPLKRLEALITGPILWKRENGAAIARLIVSEHLRLEQSYPREVEEIQASVRAPIVQAIRDAIDAGELPPRDDPERDAWSIVALTRTSYHQLAFGISDLTPEYVAKHLWKFSLAALRN